MSRRSSFHEMFKTLFARMLATYLVVTLLLLAFLGLTVSGMFQNQYISEKESELIREAEEINSIVVTKYIDDEKRPVAKDELLTISRKYNALIQIFFADPKFGKTSFMDSESEGKWGSYNALDLTSNVESIITTPPTEPQISTSMLNEYVDIPVMSLSRAIVDADGQSVGALFLHTDMSRTNASIRQVFFDVLLTACVAVILAFMAVSYITSRITRPIVEMNSTVRRFAKGDFDARVKVVGADEVSQLGNSFNAMADELNALEKVRRSFVANVSHELRSPLTSMRGFLEAMQDGTIGEDERDKYLGVVIDENKRMTGMVNDLLDLARIESGSYDTTRTQFDINELIMRTMFTFEARINAKHIDVDMRFDAEHIMVEANSDQIAQIIRNLVDNALKFSNDGGTLCVSTLCDKKKVTVSVRDSGTGISKEDLPYVFDRFYKAEKAHTPSGSSSGLGLSIVKRIIEQHGEDITVESEEGKYTCFSFTLTRYIDTNGKKPRTVRENA